MRTGNNRNWHLSMSGDPSSVEISNYIYNETCTSETPRGIQSIYYPWFRGSSNLAQFRPNERYLRAPVNLHFPSGPNPNNPNFRNFSTYSTRTSSRSNNLGRYQRQNGRFLRSGIHDNNRTYHYSNQVVLNPSRPAERRMNTRGSNYFVRTCIRNHRRAPVSVIHDHLETNSKEASQAVIASSLRKYKTNTSEGESNELPKECDPTFGSKSSCYGVLSDYSGPNLEHNLREKLITQLRNNSYECMICISIIRSHDSIWNCSVCYHLYHLKCIKLWITKLKVDRENNPCDVTDSWRCPSCQTEYKTAEKSLGYYCFCGRQRNPTYHPAHNTIPHGCDQLCGKIKGHGHAVDKYVNTFACNHQCAELCHPGPCPTCVAVVDMYCPCGKIKRSATCGDPSPSPCGQICEKKLSDPGNSSICTVGFHLCMSACHYGPCPPCNWFYYAGCYCGQEKKKFHCGSEKSTDLVLSDDDIKRLKKISKLYDKLNMNNINLQKKTEDFQSLPDISSIKLSILSGNDFSTLSSTNLEKSQSLSNLTHYCNKKSLQSDDQRIFKPPLPIELGPSFSCGRICGRQLNCGVHSCAELCHSTNCKPCPLDPKHCLTCPCGRVPLTKLVPNSDLHGNRKTCTDPIPTCPNICSRPNPVCGHPCPLVCHMGPCPACQLSITVKCRCGRTSKETTCKQFAESTQREGEPELICERICKKKKSCGRHKCKNKCCIEPSHLCYEICNRRLSCQQHNCEDTCHPGPCNSCWRGVIYSELTCRCGLTVLQPPQPCGSSPPECSFLCNRPHDCDHPVRHNCHNEPTCPPCTVLMIKVCPGGHGVQFSMPCFQPVLSCGRICGKQLDDCSHQCQRICHFGPCTEQPLAGDSPLKCTQPCQKPRPECGHPCSQPCHEVSGLTCIQAASPKYGMPSCKVPIEVVCQCGKRKENLPCHQVQNKMFLLIVNQEKQNNMPSSSTSTSLFIDKDLVNNRNLLACDKNCTRGIIDTSRFANTENWKRGFDANIDIEPDIDAKTPFEEPEYSDSLKQFALNNLAFATSVERQFKNMFFQFFKQPENNTSSDVQIPTVINYHFAPMNKRRRNFIHELAEFYGMEAFSMDPDSHRHVMVLAKRGCVKLPGGALDHRASLTNTLKKEFPGMTKFIDHLNISKPTGDKPRPKLPISNVSSLSYARILSEEERKTSKE